MIPPTALTRVFDTGGRAGLEVDAVPAQSEGFTTPNAGHCIKPPKGGETVALNVCEEVTQLFGSPQ